MKTETKYLAIYGSSSRAPESVMAIPVKVIGEKNQFGQRRVCVEPIGGTGQAWVIADRLADTPEAATPAQED